jgi:hypothetical protein
VDDDFHHLLGSVSLDAPGSFVALWERAFVFPWQTLPVRHLRTFLGWIGLHVVANKPDLISRCFSAVTHCSLQSHVLGGPPAIPPISSLPLATSPSPSALQLRVAILEAGGAPAEHASIGDLQELLARLAPRWSYTPLLGHHQLTLARLQSSPDSYLAEMFFQLGLPQPDRPTPALLATRIWDELSAVSQLPQSQLRQGPTPPQDSRVPMEAHISPQYQTSPLVTGPISQGSPILDRLRGLSLLPSVPPPLEVPSETDDVSHVSIPQFNDMILRSRDLTRGLLPDQKVHFEASLVTASSIGRILVIMSQDGTPTNFFLVDHLVMAEGSSIGVNVVNVTHPSHGRGSILSAIVIHNTQAIFLSEKSFSTFSPLLLLPSSPYSTQLAHELRAAPRDCAATVGVLHALPVPKIKEGQYNRQTMQHIGTYPITLVAKTSMDPSKSYQFNPHALLNSIATSHNAHAQLSRAEFLLGLHNVALIDWYAWTPVRLWQCAATAMETSMRFNTLGETDPIAVSRCDTHILRSFIGPTLDNVWTHLSYAFLWEPAVLQAFKDVTTRLVRMVSHYESADDHAIIPVLMSEILFQVSTLLRVFNSSGALYQSIHLPHPLPTETSVHLIQALATLPYLHPNGPTQIRIFHLLTPKTMGKSLGGPVSSPAAPLGTPGSAQSTPSQRKRKRTSPDGNPSVVKPGTRATDRSHGGGLLRPKKARPDSLCHRFSTVEGCNMGTDCRFIHAHPTSPVDKSALTAFAERRRLRVKTF